MAQTDKFGYHEVLDRLSIILNNLDDYVLKHKAVKKHKKLKKKIQKAEEILADCYQEVGQLSFEKFK